MLKTFCIISRNVCSTLVSKNIYTMSPVQNTSLCILALCLTHIKTYSSTQKVFIEIPVTVVVETKQNKAWFPPSGS